MPVSEIPAQTLQELKICCEALEDKKALDLKVLNVTGKSSVTDFFILATGNSEPHLRALRSSVEVALKGAKIRLVGVDAGQHAGWLVIDAFDFMIHIFLDTERRNYNLDALWKDAEAIPVADIIQG